MDDLYEDLYYELKDDFEYIKEYRKIADEIELLEKKEELKRTLEECDRLYYLKVRRAEIYAIINFMKYVEELNILC